LEKKRRVETEKLGINFTKLDETVEDLERRATCYSGAKITGANTRIFLLAD
jgi:hypothetical protein